MSHACTTKTHQVGKLLALTDRELLRHLEQAAADDPLRAVHLCFELIIGQRQRDYDRPALSRAVAATLRECATSIAMHG